MILITEKDESQFKYKILDWHRRITRNQFDSVSSHDSFDVTTLKQSKSSNSVTKKRSREKKLYFCKYIFSNFMKNNFQNFQNFEKLVIKLSANRTHTKTSICYGWSGFNNLLSK